MLVLDASVVLELILQTKSGIAAGPMLTRHEIAVPHLVDLEVIQVLRRLVMEGKIPEQRANDALTDFTDMRLQRYSHIDLLPRVWQMRSNLTAHDAAYVALAEQLGSSLVTRDRRMARAAQQFVTAHVM